MDTFCLKVQQLKPFWVSDKTLSMDGLSPGLAVNLYFHSFPSPHIYAYIYCLLEFCWFNSMLKSHLQTFGF